MNNAKGVAIEAVVPGSQAEKVGFRAGDTLLSIDGNKIRDVIDVIFYGSEPPSKVQIKRGHQRINLDLSGLSEGSNIFSTHMMTLKPFTVRRCKNNCLFCFVSQMPKGLRKSLYVKDEDYRMSFLYGNYITLTNLDDEDKQRILSQRLSPLYVSVHCTDNERRNLLLGNKKAPPVMNEIKFFAKHRIRMHTQIVVCPSINDGPVLESTLSDLCKFYPYVMSIAVVPVGLTAHRRKRLKGFDKSLAIDTLQIVERFQNRFRRKHGEGIVYGADELYLKAERPFPDITAYDELPQLENGVGMVPLFLHNSKRLKLKKMLSGISTSVKLCTFTGASFFPFLRDFVSQIRGLGIDIEAHEVPNTFFGTSVTVAGLLSGRDIIKTLADKVSAGSIILIPEVCLKDGEGAFVDNVTVADIEDILQARAIVIPATPEGLLEGIVRASTSPRRS